MVTLRVNSPVPLIVVTWLVWVLDLVGTRMLATIAS
jgi:hypothetical protein